MVTVLDERQTGYAVSDRWDSVRTDGSRQAVAAGRVPPSCARVAYDHGPGTRRWLSPHCRAHRLLARADDPASLRSEAERLRAQSTGLAAQAHTVLLELYALETQLAGAEARLAALRSKQARLEDEEASARRQLAVARSSLRAAERGLARRLQTLYVEGEVDPLAVLLGAESLDDALTALDGSAMSPTRTSRSSTRYGERGQLKRSCRR